MDNVVRSGRVADLSVTENEAIEGIRDLFKYIQADSEVDATAMGTVGSKGYDGFLYAIQL